MSEDASEQDPSNEHGISMLQPLKTLLHQGDAEIACTTADLMKMRRVSFQRQFGVQPSTGLRHQHGQAHSVVLLPDVEFEAGSAIQAQHAEFDEDGGRVQPWDATACLFPGVKWAMF